MEQHPKFTERRRFKRRSIDLAVSFYCQDVLDRSDWHLGMIKDASTGGILVKARRALTLLRGQRLDVLCQPDTDQFSNTREPVRIQRRVAWQDAGRQVFGLQYL